MNQYDTPADMSETSQAALNIHKDARAIVRLVQCSKCNLPLRLPVTLPCGNSICKQCLPPSHPRHNITYPASPSRLNGVTCPFPDCLRDHANDECSVNMALLEFSEGLSKLVTTYQSKFQDAPDIHMEEIVTQETQVADSESEKPQIESEKSHTMTARGNRLLATYRFAESGNLRYSSEIEFSDADNASTASTLDLEIGLALQEFSRKDLECHICYNLMLEPTSTPCGHTWCRKCLHRVMDHSHQCATCRRELRLPFGFDRLPANKYLIAILNAILPADLAIRADLDRLEETQPAGEMDTALFLCTTAFPSMPTYLHIFEPRYRLMVRRALNGNRQFGMVTYNERCAPQEELGTTQFMRYGTMLEIQRYQMFPDGRSFIECRGVGRFRVLQYGMTDGYTVGRVEKVEDIGIAEEEAIEARETVQAPQTVSENQSVEIDCMTTAQLQEIGNNFVARARQQSARWLQGTVIDAYGPAPTDPALFPYWFASVLPLGDMEKYLLLPTTSVRERLKITARWIQRIEAARWYQNSACQVLWLAVIVAIFAVLLYYQEPEVVIFIA